MVYFSFHLLYSILLCCLAWSTLARLCSLFLSILYNFCHIYILHLLFLLQHLFFYNSINLPALMCRNHKRPTAVTIAFNIKRRRPLTGKRSRYDTINSVNGWNISEVQEITAVFEIHNSDASPDTEWQRLEIRFAHWGMKLFQEGFGAQRQGALVLLSRRSRLLGVLFALRNRPKLRTEVLALRSYYRDIFCG